MVKRKERQLSREDLIAKHLKERAQYWLKSTPQFVPTKTAEGVQLFLFDQKLEEHCFILFLGECTDPLWFDSVQLFQTLLARYPALPWTPGCILPLRYHFLREEKFYARLDVGDTLDQLLLVLDPITEFAQLLNCVDHPTIVFYSGPRQLKSWDLHKNKLNEISQDLEFLLQAELRKKDKGLPMPLVYKADRKLSQSLKRFPIQQGLSGSWGPQLGGTTPTGAACKMRIDIETTKAYAILDIPTDHSNTRIVVKWSGNPILESLAGANIKFSMGQSVVEVDKSTGIYELLQSTDGLVNGFLELEFPDPKESNVLYYGIEILE